MAAAQRLLFLSTPSARRATRPAQKAADRPRISIHALREEGDCSVQHELHLLAYFYPRPPRGGRREPESRFCCCRKFLSTPSARRATHHVFDALFRSLISIHALREEGDHGPCLLLPLQVQFLSTPSARRATEDGGARHIPTRDFYPRPPRGGRRLMLLSKKSLLHFYPRPPRGGRPGRNNRPAAPSDISIHALREEGDSKNRDKISIFKQIIQHSARI